MIRARLHFPIVVVFVLIAWPHVAMAQDADRILAEAEARHRSRSQEYAGEVIVTNRAGTERRKTWKSYREGHGATAKRLIRFLGPPEVRGVAFLSRGRAGGQPDQWLYLPSMKRERRLAPQDRDASFVGTDFNYEDLDNLDRTEYSATLLADETVDGQSCYAFEMLPRGRSVYVKKVLVLRKDTLVPVRLDAFRKGERAASKVLRFSDYAQVDGHWVARRLEMTDVAKGSRTQLLLSEIRFDRPLPPDRYTVQNLVREDSVSAPSPAPTPFAQRAPALSRQAREAAPENGPRLVTFSRPTGFAEVKLGALPLTRTSADRHLVSWTTVRVRETATLGRARVVAVLAAEAISGHQQGKVQWDPADRLPKRSPLSIRELFVTVPIVGGAVDITGGRFTPAWGRTETYSPADWFLPRDATDPLASEKLPLWGARVSGEAGAFRFEAFHAATTTPWRLPRMDGRYSPFGAVRVFLDAPAGDPPRRGFTMLRLTRQGGGWDIGAWGRSGVRPAPLLSGDLDAARHVGDDRYVATTRRFATERSGGVEIARGVGGWALRGEAAYLSSPDPDLGGASVLTFEAERQTGDATLLVTIAGAIPRPPIDSLLVFDRAVLPAVLMSWTQQQSWGQWKISWMGTADKVGGLLRAEVVDLLSDHWTLTINSDLPHGARLSPLGAFGAARRVSTSLRFCW